MIEAWGSGIPKMMGAIKEYGLSEPEFYENEIGFHINLYRNTENAMVDADTAQVLKKITQATQDTTQGIIQARLREKEKVVLVPELISKVQKSPF